MGFYLNQFEPYTAPKEGEDSPDIWAAMQAGAGVAIRQRTPFISGFIDTDVEDDAELLIQEAVDNGSFPEEVNRYFGGNLRAKLNYAEKRLSGSTLPTNADIDERVKAEYAGEREEADRVYQNASTPGKIGFKIAEAITPLVSPAYWYGFTYSIRTAVPVLKGLLRITAIEAGTEVAVQPDISRQLIRAGSPRDTAQAWTEGLINTTVATGVTSALFMGAKVLKNVVRAREIAAKQGLGSTIEPDLKLSEDVAKIEPDNPFIDSMEKIGEDDVARQKAYVDSAEELPVEGDLRSIEEVQAARNTDPELNEFVPDEAGSQQRLPEGDEKVAPNGSKAEVKAEDIKTYNESVDKAFDTDTAAQIKEDAATIRAIDEACGTGGK